MKKNSALLKRQIYKLPLMMVGLLVLGIVLVPVSLSRHANAAGQITIRKLTLSSGVPLASGVTYTFDFTPFATSQIQGLKFKACTTAVGTYPNGTCTAPPGMTGAGNGFTSAAFGSQSGFQGATSFATDLTGANDCLAAGNILCAKRTDTTSQTVTNHTISFNTIKNPNTSIASPGGTAFYIGIYTYTTNTWTAPAVDFGATASAVVQTLTTNAAVAEILNFCIGSTTVDDPDTTLIASDCLGISGTSINLGTLDVSQTNISPWTTDGGDSKNAVAMVRSNAGNGVIVDYDAIQQSGTNHQGTLRISGSTCNAVTNTFVDPCINAAGSQQAFVPGTEMFGMTIAGVNCKGTSSYTCTFAGGTYNLIPQTGYIGDTLTTYGTTNGFAWDESGTATTIASSASSTVKQVDDEALILKYAATPSITTPFGPYAAQTDFIAIATY
jgi:hypothetical protein